jgi:hypothetical protein
MRSLWSVRAGTRFAQPAFALDAALMNLGYITGPVLASALAAGVSPAAALGVLLALTGAAMVIIGRQPKDQPADHPRERHANHPREQHACDPPERPAWRRFPLWSGALGRLLLTAALVDAALTATEVAVTGYVRHHHVPWASGPLLAEVSIGCILGSLLLGPRSRSLPAMTAGFAGGLALLTAAGLDAPLLAVAAPLAGLFLGPVLATLFGAAAAAAPSGSGTETQAWLNSIMNGGAAAGAAITGAVLTGAGASRPILALALACALALGAAASAAIGGARTIAGARAGPVR